MNVYRALPLLFICGLAAIVVLAMPTFGSVDSIAFWAGTQLFLEGKDPYDSTLLLAKQLEVDGTRTIAQRFLNPPWALPLLIPIFAANLSLSKFLLFSINGCILWGTFLRCRTLLGHLSLVPSTVFFLFLPFVSCLHVGQVSLFLLLGIVLAYEALQDLNTHWGKMTVALYLLSIKPQSVYVVIVLLLLTLLREATAITAAKICVFISPLLAFLVVNDDLFSPWRQSLRFGFTLRTSSLATPLRDALFEYASSYYSLFWLLQAVVLVGCIILFRARIGRLTLYPCLLVSILTAPYSWLYDFSTLGPLFFALLVLFDRGTTSKWFLALPLLLLVCPLYALGYRSPEVFICHSIIMALVYATYSKQIKVLLNGEPQLLRA